MYSKLLLEDCNFRACPVEMPGMQESL